MQHQLITIFGFGPVGEATAQRLSAEGRVSRIAQRNRPANLPANASFVTCDILDAAQVLAATQGASQIVVAVGFQYDGKIWQDVWPRAMKNLVTACEDTGARMVFLDNLYMYGPQSEPLRENMPLSDMPRKPAARTAATRIWQASKARITALRAPDFYGPNVKLSQLGEQAFAPLAKGKSATLVCPPDTLHDFAYVPDIARAIVTLLDAPDNAFGQVWHMPCAPTKTPRALVELGATALGVKPKINALPLWMLPVLGLFVPFLREVHEMRFQWNRPYYVDANKFKARFWSDVTSFDDGIKATALSFKA